MKTTTTLSALLATMVLQPAMAESWGTMCTDINFVGSCTTYQANDNQCVSFTGGASVWNDVVSSLSVIGGARCMFYTDTNCGGAVDSYTAGRHNTVTRNDAYSAFRCTYTARAADDAPKASKISSRITGGEREIEDVEDA